MVSLSKRDIRMELEQLHKEMDAIGTLHLPDVSHLRYFPEYMAFISDVDCAYRKKELPYKSSGGENMNKDILSRFWKFSGKWSAEERERWLLVNSYLNASMQISLWEKIRLAKTKEEAFKLLTLHCDLVFDQYVTVEIQKLFSKDIHKMFGILRL